MTELITIFYLGSQQYILTAQLFVLLDQDIRGLFTDRDILDEPFDKF